MNEYKNLLGKHHLQHILEKEWIYISKEDNKEAIDKAGQEHYEMIKEITDRQKNDWDIYNTSGNKN
ncbi:MAG: hypothetical protein LBP53_00940 [Candidatus Peribacteria bacterium]|jgi:hypothetical protein|nr:hypothetical protein [Candidatus Peribacteria bacterium]